MQIDGVAAVVTGGASGLGGAVAKRLAAAGAKVFAALGKTLIFSWLGSLVSLIGALPGVAFASWVGGVEHWSARPTHGGVRASAAQQ